MLRFPGYLLCHPRKVERIELRAAGRRHIVLLAALVCSLVPTCVVLDSTKGVEKMAIDGEAP